ncbi:MFS transporter [Rhizobium sp. CCGE531]|uniref:MFS transporter n=1 Tax=Rhizobium sp. CCGE531 TaxID=2364271 RepID=UPI000EA9A136|nr:MFS transporter [Rhizobium sp. CCGE531]AYG70637.1 MFS transporter [Rhizobium sp. CCGE531]
MPQQEVRFTVLNSGNKLGNASSYLNSSAPYWRKNLIVCAAGSFTTTVAMTMILPFLPLYIRELGVSDQASIAQFSGVAYGVTFLAAALVAPLWGRLADRYGRKAMMVRASLGVVAAMALMGVAQDVWQLLAMRFLAGLLGGYSSGSYALVATQVPKDRIGWALGFLATGIMGGNLVGPLIGGFLPTLIGIRETFFLTAALVFLTFVASAFLIREDFNARTTEREYSNSWSTIPSRRPVLAMLATGLLLMIANMSIEPITAIYISQLVEPNRHVTLWAGLVISGTAFGSVLSASHLGRLADRVGHWKVIVVAMCTAAALLLSQAFVTNVLELVGLRILMGLVLGGLLPCIGSVIRHSVPEQAVGAILGWSTSAQHAGQVLGPAIGGVLAAHAGIHSVFFFTSFLMLVGGFIAWSSRPQANSA